MDYISELKYRLIDYANRYETAEFVKNDPVQFPRMFSEKKDIEISGFITSWISYGNRSQIIKTAKMLHILMDWKPYNYLMNRQDMWNCYKDNPISLYRFFTYGDYYNLLSRLRVLYSMNDDMESRLSDKQDLTRALQVIFSLINGVPFLETSACKRLSMFLRWMVRRNSPVDIGIWNSISPERLIIPLDVHVYKQALKMGITKRKSVDKRTALEITNFFADIFPGDPARGDYSLFGYSVNNKHYER